jgi:hypothetical protein
MSSEFDEWMKLGNQYYAKKDVKKAEECWKMAEKVRTASPSDVLLYKDALRRALRDGNW